MNINIGARITVKCNSHDPKEVAISLNDAERYYGLSSRGGGWTPKIPRWRVNEKGEVVLPRTAPTIMSGPNVAFWLGRFNGIDPIRDIKWDIEE